jgi:ligand-binding sensor domain-containing protein
MAFAPSSPNVAYLTSLIVEQVHHGVYKSGDGGFTWYGTGLVNISTTALAVSPVNANVVYVASTNPGIVYYSTNGGVNWQETSLSAGSIYTLAFSAQDGSRVYAGTNNGVYVRIGEGDWTQVGLGGVAVTVLGADPARTGRLFAGTTQGVYLTYNGGIDWAQGASELSTDTIMSIGFDPLDARWVYFGTKTRGIVNANFP